MDFTDWKTLTDFLEYHALYYENLEDMAYDQNLFSAVVQDHLEKETGHVIPEQDNYNTFIGDVPVLKFFYGFDLHQFTTETDVYLDGYGIPPDSVTELVPNLYIGGALTAWALLPWAGSGIGAASPFTDNNFTVKNLNNWGMVKNV